VSRPNFHICNFPEGKLPTTKAQSRELHMFRHSPALSAVTYDNMYTLSAQRNPPQPEQQSVGCCGSVSDRRRRDDLGKDALTSFQVLEQMQCARNIYAAIQPQSPNGLTSSCSISSPSLGSWSPLTSSAQSPSTTQDSKQARRREQNRRSQRAYRDRKEKQLKILEDQIAQLEAKHQSLLKSYSSQSSEIVKLKSEIEKISNEITALQTASLTKPPDDFDFDFGPRFGSIIKGETWSCFPQL